MQDVKGWETLHEKLGNKCLLIADKVLSKGLPLKSPPSNVANATDSEPSQAQAEDAEASGELSNQSGEGGGKERTGDKVEAATPEEQEPRLGYLSCAGIQFETTVWSTMQKAAALKGDFIQYVCGVGGGGRGGGGECVYVSECIIPSLSGSDLAMGGSL